MSDASLTVFRTKDPVEGEIVVDLLRQEGVEARLLGTRVASLIGVAPNVFDNGHHVESTCGTVIIIGLVIADLVGGQRAVRAYNRGARAGVLRELGAGALLLAIVYTAGILIGTHLPPPKPKRTYYYSDP